MLRTFIQNVFSYNRQNIYDVINHQYHDYLTDRDPQTMKDFVAGFLGDALQVAPNVELVRRRVSKNRKSDVLEENVAKRTQENTETYVFVFNANYFLENKETKTFLENSTHHRKALRRPSLSSFPSSSSSSPFPSLSSSSSSLEENLMDYLFGTTFMAYERDRSKSLKDRQLSEIIIAYWSNFIHTGFVQVFIFFIFILFLIIFFYFCIIFTFIFIFQNVISFFYFPKENITQFFKKINFHF